MITSPAQTLGVIEARGGNMDLCIWCGGASFTGHSNFMNIIFLDGHSKATKWARTFRPACMWTFDNNLSDADAASYAATCNRDDCN